MRRLVVAAAILDHAAAPTRLLAARRRRPASLAGRWELPGGKVEPSEDPAAALHREIREELGVSLTLGRRVPGPLAGDWPIDERLTMRVWLAVVRGGEPAAGEDHDELRWLVAGDALELAWLPADVPIAGELDAWLRAAGPVT